MKCKIKGRSFYCIQLFCLWLMYSNVCSAQELNLQYTTQRNCSNPRFAGLSNTGVAIPEAVSSTFLNPSLVHFWHWKNESHYSAYFLYENDEYFKKTNFSTGASWYIYEKTSIGAVYRHLQRDDNRYQNEMFINISGMLFDKSLDQGAVNIGVNIHYEDLKWLYNDLDSTLTIKNTTIDTTQKVIGTYFSDVNKRLIEQRRLFFDLGFYQDNIFPGMDFGLSFHNLLGRFWGSENPTLSHIIDTIPDSTQNPAIADTIVDSSFYRYEWSKKKGRSPKEYKRMTVGITYNIRLVDNLVMVVVPFDLEFLGLFDKKKTIKIAMHTGIEGWLNEKICLRFGYSRAPDSIYGKEKPLKISFTNILCGGASVRFEHIAFDVYMKKNEWGIGSVVAF